ncbi:MAG: amidohydrolase family protein, partial [Deltaproteobacteria bacterium]|nr:amidohydrolase family protein [Deltaproteobacteria bacterium]
MSLRYFLTTLTVLAWVLVSAPEAMVQSADVIISNSKILTVDPSFSVAHSLAIDNGRIVAVGSAQAVARHKGPNTRIIDLGGRTVIPGLIDNHFHFIRSVWNYQREVRLDGVTSRAEALAMIAAKAASVPRGQWITVLGGWSPAQFRDEPGGFTLAELDAAAPDNPVYIQQSYRTAYANSVALKAVGRDPAEGARMLGRQSFRPFGRFIGWRNKSSSKEAILAYMAALNRVGLTTVYDIGRPSEGKLAPVASLAAAGPMPLRVFHTLRYRATDPQSTDAALKLITGGAARPFSTTDQFGVIGLGEHIYGPMHDRANRRAPWEEAVWGPVRTISHAAAKHGWPIHEHTMSGPTISQFID